MQFNLSRPRCLLLTMLVIALPSQAMAREAVEGVWRNRPNTLVVRIAPCGTALCGTVVGADAAAKASTRKAGTAKLVGTRLLTGFTRSADGSYRGDIFNPNLNIHASGTVTVESPSVLVVKGCVLAGMICKQQHWLRVG